MSTVENKIDFSHPFSLHDACCLDRTVSVSVIGSMNSEELSLLENINFNFIDSGWPLELNEEDHLFAEKFPVNLEEAIKDGDIVSFGEIDKKDEKNIENNILDKFYNIFYSHFPKLKGKKLSQGAFSSYFAHIHNDKTFCPIRGQVNLVIDNPKGHALISRSSDGIDHKIIPQKGDIIFLDIHCDHAIIPNQEEGFDVMRENPMVVAYIS